jgi:hypothetical protein
VLKLEDQDQDVVNMEIGALVSGLSYVLDSSWRPGKCCRWRRILPCEDRFVVVRTTDRNAIATIQLDCLVSCFLVCRICLYAVAKPLAIPTFDVVENTNIVVRHFCIRSDVFSSAGNWNCHVFDLRVLCFCLCDPLGITHR